MRKAPVATALGTLLLLGATVGLTAARAAAPPNVTTISVYRSVFTPSMLTGANGLVVTLENRDTISHRIVLSRGRVNSPTSFDVTLAPGQSYTSPTPLSCTGSCVTVTYTYRDASLSSLSTTGYCNTFCARIYLYNDGS